MIRWSARDRAGWLRVCDTFEQAWAACAPGGRVYRFDAAGNRTLSARKALVA